MLCTLLVQFCCKNSERCTTVPWAFSAKHLSLHGLWPGYLAGGYPESCKAKAHLLSEAMPRDYIDLAPAFTRWNMEKHRAEVGDLAKHEWKKHGTCSGLSPDMYWTEALRAMTALPGERGTPGIITANIGGTVPAQALHASYQKRVAVRTDKQCRQAVLHRPVPRATETPETNTPRYRDQCASLLRAGAVLHGSRVLAAIRGTTLALSPLNTDTRSFYLLSPTG